MSNFSGERDKKVKSDGAHPNIRATDMTRVENIPVELQMNNWQVTL